MMRIGRLARRAGVGVETVRFYERKGLIEQPRRPERGTRVYPDDAAERIRFIRYAQDLGFSLREVGELLSLRADPGTDCAEVRARAIEKRDDVQAKLGRLARMRDALDELIASCPGAGAVKACTILDAMQDRAAATEAKPRLSTPKSEMGRRKMKTTVLAVAGMHCDGCARTIEALLARVPGVRKVEASFGEGRVRVLHDPTSAPEADLEAAVAKGGFKVTNGRQ